MKCIYCAYAQSSVTTILEQDLFYSAYIWSVFSNIDKTHIPDDEKLLAALSAIAAVSWSSFGWLLSPPDERPACDIVLVVMDGERSDGSKSFFQKILTDLCFASSLFLRFMILVHIMILDTLFLFVFLLDWMPFCRAMTCLLMPVPKPKTKFVTCDQFC